MTTRLVIEIASFCIALVGFAIGTISMHEMINEINRSADRYKTYSHFGFSPGRILFILPEYRRRYPRGKLSTRWRRSTFLAVAAFAVVIVCLMK